MDTQPQLCFGFSFAEGGGWGSLKPYQVFCSSKIQCHRMKQEAEKKDVYNSLTSARWQSMLCKLILYHNCASQY